MERDGMSAVPPPLSYVTSQEMRCLLHWLSGWSSAQRECFIRDMVDKAVPWKVLPLLEGLAGLSMDPGKPPSIFECQMRLWDQWFRGWTQEERNEFVRQMEEALPEVASRMYQEIAATAGKD
ncbi:uncharacterized protein C14orf119 homolog isoform X2 [Anolis carolinensis]|uniref:uncharacterized protein C14orf119 homolog isoform X2 n=1 Tax=Anolis carolinensis TaxID=28377 RepID=UPI000462D111